MTELFATAHSPEPTVAPRPWALPPRAPVAGKVDVLRRIVQSAPVRIVVGLTLCLVVPPLLLRAARPLLGADLPARTVLPPLLATAVLLLAYAVVVRVLERRAVRELAGKRALPHLTLGVAAGALCFGTVLVLLLALEAYRIVGVQPPRGLGGLLSLYLYLAFLEEVVFRGLLQRILEESLGTWVALLASNALFAFAHLDNPGATALSTAGVAVAGLALGLLFLLARSLWWPMAAHFAWNATQTALGAPVSGHDEVAGALLRLAPRGEVWLTGGEFGPEGSVVTLLALVALAAALVGAARAQRLPLPPRWRRRRQASPQARPASSGPVTPS